MLAGNAAMKDIQSLREDMDEETRDSNYGESVLATPFPVFRGFVYNLFSNCDYSVNDGAFININLCPLNQ